jgi:predicted NBD/HSP70 family sugar kinase
MFSTESSPCWAASTLLSGSGPLPWAFSYTGLVDDSGGVTAVNLGWKAFPLARRLEQFIDLPIYYANDSVWKILAERWLGVARNCGSRKS